MDHNPSAFVKVKEEPDMDSSYGSNTMHQKDTAEQPKGVDKLSIASINFQVKEEPDVSTVGYGSSVNNQDVVRSDENESSHVNRWILNSSGTAYVQTNRDDINDELGSAMDSKTGVRNNVSDHVKQENDADPVVVKTELDDDSCELQGDTMDEKDKTIAENVDKCAVGKLEVDPEQILIKTEKDPGSNLIQEEEIHAPITNDLSDELTIARESLFKPYSCRLCGEMFSEKAELYNHSWRHEDEKPFLCVECGKTFPQVAYLNRHMKRHGEKQYACAVCEKRFFHSGDLNRHERTHTGEKLFRCRICGKSYTQKFALDRHAEMQH